MTKPKDDDRGSRATHCSSASFMSKKLEALYEELENARGGGNSGDIENAWAAICAYQHRQLIEGIRSVQELIANSEGVTGLHKNGDIATWDELLGSGWLEEFNEAVDVAEKH